MSNQTDYINSKLWELEKLWPLSGEDKELLVIFAKMLLPVEEGDK